MLSRREFPARMEDDGNNYSTTSDSNSKSTVPDDEQEQEVDDNIEMVHPVEWNAMNGSHGIP